MPLDRPSSSLQNKELDCPEKPKHLTGFIERDADEVHQERQHNQDLDAVLAARRDAGNAWLYAVRAGENAIAHTHRFAIDQAPDGTFTHQLAIGAANAIGINIVHPIRLGKLQFGRCATRGFLAAAPTSSSLVFRMHTIGGVGCWLVGSTRSRFGFILRETLSKPALVGFQSSNRLLEIFNKVEQLLDGELAAASVATDLAKVENQVGAVHEQHHAIQSQLVRIQAAELHRSAFLRSKAKGPWSDGARPWCGIRVWIATAISRCVVVVHFHHTEPVKAPTPIGHSAASTRMDTY